MRTGIATIMQREWVSLGPDTPMRRAAALLAGAGAAAAPVLDASGKLIGILSQKDCFRPALQASYYQEWKGTVAEAMSRDPVCLQADDDLITAAEAFMAHPHRIFPVLEGGQLVGMLRRSDVLSALLDMG
ncbi:CBS domain-containing protein [Oceanicola sp. S124]|uniref:CBS domain-containing protein n=1 Tax=Oceanicola sp. S124 TaxID=1042378 RepID=UPI000494AA0C|nr:CBS domain-containing protein [Oceanicola sp. S124]